MIDLNDDTYDVFAIKAYSSLNYIKSEFEEDSKAFKYVKRLLRRYADTGEIRENLILNHLNVIYNMFGVEAGTRLLFFRTEPEDYSSLKTFLVYLRMMPEVVFSIDGKDIISAEIPVDMNIANVLRRL